MTCVNRGIGHGFDCEADIRASARAGTLSQVRTYGYPCEMSETCQESASALISCESPARDCAVPTFVAARPLKPTSPEAAVFFVYLVVVDGGREWTA